MNEETARGLYAALSSFQRSLEGLVYAQGPVGLGAAAKLNKARRLGQEAERLMNFQFAIAGCSLYADGWYKFKRDAKAVLELVEEAGAITVGLIKSKYGTWGILYWSREELFSNHRLDADNAITSFLSDPR